MRFHLSKIRGAAVAAALLLASSCGEQHPTAARAPRSSSASASTLLECPANSSQTTSAIVGVLGGTVSLGGTSIAIPPGALSAPTLITVTVPAGQYMEVDVHANDLTSFLFNSPVSITIDYSRCNRNDIQSAPLTVWHINEQTKALIENMGGSDDKVAQSITFSTGHLSGYAVAF